MLHRLLLPALLVAGPALSSAQVKRKPAAPPPTIAQRWLNSMTLEQKVAQTVIVPIFGENLPAGSRAYRQLAALVRDQGIGGLIVINRVRHGVVRHAEPEALATFLNRMQRLARVPLIVGGDLERGASMRVEGTTKFPHNMAYAAARDLDSSSVEGAATAREARAVGIHWVFAPVADVNNNPHNPIVNIRSYSEDPREVAEHVKAYVRGAQANSSHPVLVTVKHFPGHGDTAVDSHMGLAKIEADRERFNKVELVPFRAAIEAGVDAVMSSHLWVPAVDEREIPASVSAPVLTGLLRQELGFKGLVVTDAMDMHGLSKLFPPVEAAVRAFEAGNDVLLMPPQPAAVIKGLAAAVRSGRISTARLNQSVLRILNAKIKLGLHKQKLVNIEAVADEIDSEDAEAAARRVAEKAVTLLKNDAGTLPLGRPDGSCWLVLSESRYSTAGRRMMEELGRRVPKASRMLLDPQVPATELDAAAAGAASCDSVVVGAFSGVAAFQGSVGLNEGYTKLLEAMFAAGKPVTLIALGNPYLIRAFPQVSAYLATFSTAPVSEAAAVAAVLGDIPVQGKLPVSIPPIAKVGDGITLSARPTVQ